MRPLFIVNPLSGGGRGLRTWHEIERVLGERGLPAEVRLTQGPGAATELAAAARSEGYDVVVGIGGDGTVQEIVNGLVDADGSCPTPLAIIPGGTGNDFAKMLGYPREPLAALDIALSGRVKALDLGRYDGRYFVNIAGVGFDAEVAAFLNRRPKRLPAALTYVYGVLAMLRRYRPVPLRLELDGETLEQKCLLVSVCNGDSHAGGMKMCPGAKPDDGALDICVVGDVGRLETLLLLPRVFSGRHTLHPKVKTYRTKRITIGSPRRLFVQADGEILGQLPDDAAPTVLEIHSGALRVVTGESFQ